MHICIVKVITVDTGKSQGILGGNMNSKEYKELRRIEGMVEKAAQRKEEKENSRILPYNKLNVPQSSTFFVKLRHVDPKTGKRSDSTSFVSMDTFVRKLKDHSHVYQDVVNDCLIDNLDFDKMCIGINPNVFLYLSEASQHNQEIIDFINSIRIADRKPINFLYRQNIPAEWKIIFKPYLDAYREEAKTLEVHYGGEEKLAKENEKHNKVQEILDMFESEGEMEDR